MKKKAPAPTPVALMEVANLMLTCLRDWLHDESGQFSLDLRSSNQPPASPVFGSRTVFGQWTPDTSDGKTGVLAITKEGEEAFLKRYGVALQDLAILAMNSNPFLVQVGSEERDGKTFRRLRPTLYTVDGQVVRCLIVRIPGSAEPFYPLAGLKLGLVQQWLKTNRLPSRLGAAVEARGWLWEMDLRQVLAPFLPKSFRVKS